MAIYHFSVEIASRSNGRSAVAMAAYRSGQKLTDERTGKTKRYSRTCPPDETMILAPAHAPDWVYDRNRLWNEVEKVEKQKNAQLCRHVRLALPKEFSAKLRVKAVETFCKNEWIRRGMVADISIYQDKQNPYAHIMLTMRPFQENGTWGAKSKKQYVLDADGHRIRLASGNYKSIKIPTTDWDKVETLVAWRKAWATHINAIFAKVNRSERVDHQSFKGRSLRLIPTIHEGYQSRQMEKKGISTLHGSYNRAVKAQNALVIDFISRREVKHVNEQKTAPAPITGIQERESQERTDFEKHKERLEAEYRELKEQKESLRQEREGTQKLLYWERRSMNEAKELASLTKKQSKYQEELGELKSNYLRRLFQAKERAKIKRLEETIAELDVRIVKLLRSANGFSVDHYALRIKYWESILKEVNEKLERIEDRMESIDKERAALKIRNHLRERQ